jgi:hypothetical protein
MDTTGCSFTIIDNRILNCGMMGTGIFRFFRIWRASKRRSSVKLDRLGHFYNLIDRECQKYDHSVPMSGHGEQDPKAGLEELTITRRISPVM